MTDNGWNRNWFGKAKKQHKDMQRATYHMIYLLHKLNCLPKDFRDDWTEEFRCYANRVLGKRR